MARKIIKCKIIGLTHLKQEVLDKEWSHFQEYLQQKNILWWKDYPRTIHYANAQQGDRFYKDVKEGKEYALSIRRDQFRVEKRNTKLSPYWFRVPTHHYAITGNRGKKLWVAIKPHQPIPEDVSFRESKLVKKGNDYYIHLMIQKEIVVRTSYSSILAIDLGVKWIATVCDVNNPRPMFYGRELRRVRGHYFHLRRQLARKKLLKVIKRIKDAEHRIVNDMVHKISRDIVKRAKETNTLIAIGQLKGIRELKQGRKANRKVMSFPFYKLKQQIEYKAAWEGIMVLEIDEAYTSQICSRCGLIGKRKSGLFKCTCGYQDNADRNGALNIGKRALGYISKVGVSVNMPRTETANMKTPLAMQQSISEANVEEY